VPKRSRRLQATAVLILLLRLDLKHIDGLESIYELRHGRFELGKAMVEGVLQAGSGTAESESMAGLAIGLKDDRTYELRETAGVSKCRGGFEAPQLFVSNPEGDETIPNFHKEKPDFGLGWVGLGWVGKNTMRTLT